MADWKNVSRVFMGIRMETKDIDAGPIRLAKVVVEQCPSSKGIRQLGAPPLGSILPFEGPVFTVWIPEIAYSGSLSDYSDSVFFAIDANGNWGLGLIYLTIGILQDDLEDFLSMTTIASALMEAWHVLPEDLTAFGFNEAFSRAGMGNSLATITTELANKGVFTGKVLTA